jgi:Copper type II ascorbate-dependent monooxygenase, C-terminal domain
MACISVTTTSRSAPAVYAFGMRLRYVVLGFVACALLAAGLFAVTRTAGSATGHVTTLSLQSTTSYTPSAPAGGTDDYHCTLVDPHVTADSMITSSQFFPLSPEVHHAILFLVPPNLVSQAVAADQNGKGWQCFGETVLPHFGQDIPLSKNSVSDAPWLSAWAPGRRLDVMPTGTAVTFPKGSLVIMQIHYNLLVGDQPVRSKLVLNTVPASSHLTPLRLDLLPAMPDIPCPAGVTGPLCNRAAALVDIGQRFGKSQVNFINILERTCGRSAVNPPSGNTTTCTWPSHRNVTIVRVTAHMHLIGRGMKVVLDPGTSKAKTLLDVTNYNFDNQRSYNLATPAKVSVGDTIQVTCTYDPKLRQELPQLRKLPARFVTWGDGSSDEMCLALLQSTV